MNDTLTAAALAASSGLTTPLRGGDESTTWLGSEEQSLNGKLLKARKPYTITKQRERWSEEEHLRFVEALRLHGRAWRKIEEHIGTKTAVQIRSHAQKFFNKLEKKKEAGETVEKEEDLTIPPPRPKRKPAKPYPRKDAFSASGVTDTSQLQYSPAELQAAQQQLLGGYGTTPTGAAAAAAAQHFGNFITTFAGHIGSSTVSDATVAAVTAAASAAAAAAAAAVVAAAGQEVQTHMQAHPPSCFPFFGMPPSALGQITPTHGVSAIDQAALLGPHAAAATKAAVYDRHTGSIKLEGLVSADAMDLSGLDAAGGDRGFMEATGTTDGTHISAGAQLRGSDGDSACSRETDNQNQEADDAADHGWQSRSHLLALQHHHQQSQQHNSSSANPEAAAAARSLAAAAAAQGGFDISQLLWGLSRQDHESHAAAAAAALQGATPAQALALLSNPFYQAGLAAADRTGQQNAAALQAAAAAGTSAREANQAAAGGLTRSGGGAIGSSAALDAAMPDVSGRTKSRKTTPSVNSGSTGPAAGAKRLFAVGSEECLMPIKKVAREASADNDDAEGMEVTPSSPSIQEKELKAVSQPSNTNGNTSGSNESEGSKRRQGTAQAEGSNPTNGNSSGNGYSVKDSNTGTNTGTNGHTNGTGNGYSYGNGTSAFNPVGHHHSHQASAGAHTHKFNHHQQLGANGVTSRHQHHHHHSNHAVHVHGAEGSNAANGASGTGFANGRDEGRSSSDLEGPAQQQTKPWQLQLQRSAEADDEVMVPVASVDMQEQPQDSAQATQLQALLASLHGMCNNPMMLQQAYGAAAAATAAAQQFVANAVQGNQQQGVSAQQQIAALQQQIHQHPAVQQAPATSQGFAPWHGSTSECGASGSSSFMGNGLLQHLGQSPAAQQLQAAAGLVGLAGSWGAGTTPAASGGSNSLLSTYAQLAAAAAAAQQHQQHTHQHQHSHYHYHQQQLQQQQAGSAAAAAAAVGLQQLQQGFRHSTKQQAAGVSLFGGYSGLSALEVLTRVASAGTLEAEDAAAAAAMHHRALSHDGHAVTDAALTKRQSRTL